MTSREKTSTTDPENILIVWDDPALSAALTPAPPKPERKHAS